MADLSCLLSCQKFSQCCASCQTGERPPRHAKAYRNFLEEHRRLQRERIAAFSEYIADVKEGRFPERSHLVEMDDALLQKVIGALGKTRL